MPVTAAPLLSDPMIDLRYVKKLIEMLDGSSVDSIEISSDKGMKLRISKTPQQRGPVAMATPMSAMPAVMPPVAPSLPTPSDAMSAIGDGGAAAARAEAAAKLLEVKSPMVGTFYSASDPNSPAFVSV